MLETMQIGEFQVFRELFSIGRKTGTAARISCVLLEIVSLRSFRIFSFFQVFSGRFRLRSEVQMGRAASKEVFGAFGVVRFCSILFGVGRCCAAVDGDVRVVVRFLWVGHWELLSASARDDS